jgi:site-specific recombinase XerD
MRVHVVPFFGSQRPHRIGRREIEAFIPHMARSGRSTKTTLNATGVLHSIFELARREGWVVANLCTLVDKPQAPPTDPDIRFLEPEEIGRCCAPCPATTSAASSDRCTSRQR